MRFSIRIAVAGLACAGSLGLSAAATAESDVQSELQQMREQMQALQDKVDAQERALADQAPAAEVLTQTEGDKTGNLSALSSFIEATDFYGSAAGSYVQDFEFKHNDNDSGAIAGAFPFTEFNTFALDQIWFGMNKAPTEESRGGFHVDLAYGANANGTTDTPEIYSAYASVLLPVGSGIQLDAGELWTLIGAEVVDTTANMNVTRGLLWGIQPVSHVGVLASTALADGIGFKIGAVNDPISDSNSMSEDSKGVTGQINLSGDNYFLALSGIWGSPDDGTDDDKYGLIDVLATVSPSDSFKFWVEYNFNWLEDPVPGVKDDELSINAFGAAARFAVTDTTGIAGRAEMLAYHPDQGDDEERYSVTGTLDQQIVEHVTAKAEFRYDFGTDQFFVNNDGSVSKDQAIGLVQLIYAF